MRVIGWLNRWWCAGKEVEHNISVSAPAAQLLQAFVKHEWVVVCRAYVLRCVRDKVAAWAVVGRLGEAQPEHDSSVDASAPA